MSLSGSRNWRAWKFAHWKWRTFQQWRRTTRNNFAFASLQHAIWKCRQIAGWIIWGLWWRYKPAKMHPSRPNSGVRPLEWKLTVWKYFWPQSFSSEMFYIRATTWGYNGWRVKKCTYDCTLWYYLFHFSIAYALGMPLALLIKRVAWWAESLSIFPAGTSLNRISIRNTPCPWSNSFT